MTMRWVGAGVLATVIVLWSLYPAAGAERNLVLTPVVQQTAADVDFSLPPLWRSVGPCAAQNATDNCRLVLLTADPAAAEPSDLVATARRLSQHYADLRTKKGDGYASLRAAQALLIAAAFEARYRRPVEAREDYTQAISLAAEVPVTITRFEEVVAPQSMFDVAERRMAQRSLGMRSREERSAFFTSAQLAREYATRALEALNAR